MTAVTTQQPTSLWRRIIRSRRNVLAFVLLILGLVLFSQTTSRFSADIETNLTIGARDVVVDGTTSEEAVAVAVPTRTSLVVLSLAIMGTGILGVIDPPSLKRITYWVMVMGGLLLIPAIIIFAVGDGRTNIVTLFTESLRLATPIAIGAMAGIWCERAGVVNIAIEGMMLFSACFSFTAVFLLRAYFPPEQLNLLLFIGVGAGILTGGIAALLHAWLSITFATDQIVSGTVINILAIGVTSFVRKEVLLSSEAGLATLPAIRIPILADIPIIGEALFSQKPIFYLMFVVIIITHVVLFQTKWGLRTRAVGENPHAADTLGIKVNQMRWANVFIGGLIAGLAGAWFSLEVTGRFTDNMTNGSGFIALAAMIFGKWMPAGAFGGALLFGFADALGKRFQIVGVAIPQQFLQMVPYILTMIVLAGLVGRAIPPKAVGKPYKKE